MRSEPADEIVERSGAGSVSLRTLRSQLSGTSSLAVNGGALIINVIASGLSGFVFWIIAARAVEPAVVARATAMVITMLAVVSLSQQSLTVNIPVLIAGSPRPRRLAGKAYVCGVSLTAATALLYVSVGTRLVSGLAYLRAERLAIIFVLGCVVWSIFSLQDAVLTGLRRGRLVLLENSVWGLARLLFVLALPLFGLKLQVGWLVAAWLIPASLLVAMISYFLFVLPSSPLRQPLGSDRLSRRRLVYFLGVEHLASMTGAFVALVVPAVALTSLGAGPAAPMLAAYSFVAVSENAMGSFAQAFAVEVRRNGHASRNLIALTCILLGGFSFGAIALAQLFADDFMSLFGEDYRASGGPVLAILVLGLPARCMMMLSSAGNRLRGRSWRNLAQTMIYSVALFAGLAIADVETAPALAVCLVVARYVAAAFAIINLRELKGSRDIRAADGERVSVPVAAEGH